MKRYKISTQSGKVHEMAWCVDCDWRNDNYKNALATGKIHAQTHGHQVEVEQGISVTYSPVWRKA